MEKAVELAPKRHRKAYILWSNLGDAYRFTPELAAKAPDAYRHAIEEVENQLAHEPNNVELLSRLGVYWAKSGNNDRATREIARALRLATGNAGVLFRAALVYDIGGQNDRAIAALDEAVRSGFSVDEIRREPELANLSGNPSYERLISARHSGAPN